MQQLAFKTSVHSFHLQVTPPESVKQRYNHSITASTLAPGHTKVLVFGGCHTLGGESIAETAILKFGMSFSISNCIWDMANGLKSPNECNIYSYGISLKSTVAAIYFWLSNSPEMLFIGS